MAFSKFSTGNVIAIMVCCLLVFGACKQSAVSPVAGKDETIGNYTLQVDSMHSAFEENLMFKGEWGLGIPVLCFHNKVFSVLWSKEQFRFYDMRYKEALYAIDIKEALESLYARDSTLCYVIRNRPWLYRISFEDTTLQVHRTDSVALPDIFNDSLFLADNTLSPMVVLDSGRILAPFRARNDNVNMLDTYACLELKPGKPAYHKPMIRYPDYLYSEFEYYWRFIGAYAAGTQTLFYTFQKWNKLYAWNRSTGRIDSVVLEDFHSIPYDAQKKFQIKYIRNYMEQNDCNEKLFCDNNANVFLIKKNRKGNAALSELLCFNARLQLITRVAFDYNVNDALAFIHNNKLYVKKPDNSYFIYSLVERMPPVQ